MAEQLRKSKELTQKVGPSLHETDSEDSDSENIEVSEQVVDPENPWLAERKEFTDFMKGYTNFVQNNCKTVKKDENEEMKKDQNEKITSIKEHNKIIETNKNNDDIVEFLNETKNKRNKKVKHVNFEDISDLSDGESEVEALRINTPKKKKVKFSNNCIQSETKQKETCNNNTNIDSTSSHNKESSNVEVIQTVAGTWFVSTDSINNVNSKKKKTHREVENVFKTVETELKNKINQKLEKLNQVEVTQSSHKNIIKPKHQTMNDDNYLKISNKRSKMEYSEPLYENNKISSSNLEDNQGLSAKIVENSTKPRKAPQNIDPTEFLKVTQTNLETEDMAQIEDHLDDNENNDQEKLIAEAFADDDIINEFKYLCILWLLC